MTKKEKRKKETSQTKETTDQTQASHTDNKGENDRNTSNSRSRSRGRRSLSSLFRRSRGRAESGERSSLLHNGDANSATVSDSDPRTDPRGHLQRMTVREALARNRGRSPNRRTKKLERQLLDNEHRLSGDSLSISLPHLPDHLTEDQSDVPANQTVSTEALSGSTMPRVKKRRGQSEGRGAQRFWQSDYQDSNISSVQDKSVQILPLDKRKYLIHKEVNIIEPDNVDTFITHNDTNRTHSNINENKIFVELSESEKRRRESYNQFITLREKKPTHSFFQVPTENTCDNVIDTTSDLPTVNINSSTPLGSNLHSMEAFHEQNSDEHDSGFESKLTNKDKKRNAKGKSEDRFIEASNSDYGYTGASSIPVDENSPSKTNKVRRSAYVSPRRFSRSSRTSVTSNKSIVSDISNHSLLSEEKNHQQSVEPERGPGKYRRFFSRENKKKPSVVHEKDGNNSNQQQMIDASTSMNEIFSLSMPAESRNLLNGSKIAKTVETEQLLSENESSHCIADKEIEEGEEIILTSKSEKITDDTGLKTELCTEADAPANNSAPSLQREVIVIDSLDSEKNIQTHEHENVFRPIQPDINMEVTEECLPKEEGTTIHKAQHVTFDTDEIEVISSDMLTENEQKKLTVKTPLEQEISKDNHENAEKGHHEKSDKLSKSFWSGKSKKDKRKSKKKKEKQRKGSCASNKSTEKDNAEIEDLQICQEKDTNIHVTNTENDEGKPLSASFKGKKRKSFLKKRSKEKQIKSKAAKPLTRTASLSKFIDKRESVLSEERRNSLTIMNKRSRSMDDISKDKDTQKINIKQKQPKEDALKTINKESRESKSVETKEMKPQPKLSIAAIVAIRAKISRMKKAKQLQAEMNKREETDKPDLNLGEISPKGETIQETEENADMSVAKVFYENEINTSIGKSDNSLAIIEDTDQEVKDLVYDKHIQFAPYCDDTISEEEMIKQRQRNTRLTSRRESKVRQRQKKVINCCKKGIAFLFSHIGLCSLVVGYCILGGIVFKALEGDNEIEQKKEIRELRQNFTEKIYRLAFETTLTKGSREVFIQEVNEILKNFSVMIHKQTKEAGWDGKEIRMVKNEFEEPMEPEPEQWSYPSSLLYAITVMTTIGYGHVAPKTDEGRIMTIAYAVLGIPLTLLCLTNIGDLMAHGFRSLYGKVCCGLCCILFRPRRRRRLDPERGLSGAEERMIMQENEKSGELIHVPTSVCLLLMSSYIMLGTFLFAEWEDWDVVTGTYFCFITLSTIGFGDVVPGMSQSDWNQQEKLVSCALYLVFGLSLIAMCFNLVQEDVKAKCKWLGMKLGIIDKPVSSV